MIRMSVDNGIFLGSSCEVYTDSKVFKYKIVHGGFPCFCLFICDPSANQHVDGKKIMT